MARHTKIKARVKNIDVMLKKSDIAADQFDEEADVPHIEMLQEMR